MKRKFLWVMFLVLLSGGILNAQTDELSDLKMQIAKQNEKLQLLQEKLEKYEKHHQQNNQILAQHISELSSQKAAEPKLPDALKWAEKVKFSGEFRYRHETIEAENDGKPDRHRNRFRARIGLKTKVNDEWDLGFRFASGNEDPVSTNQTLNSSFATKDFWIDKAYLDFHPEAVKGLHIIGGKMSNPFYKVGKNQLIWDGDLTPEGIAAKHIFFLGESGEIFINGGGFFVTESSSSDTDMSVWGVQSGLKH